ncbi:MAG: hypothetical protein ITG00_08690 [Flavobacterium sp.]|nr:hypothetical protein [Flavobacterium sp.]
MNYLKYTQYVYLVAALFFLYDGITKYSEGEENAWFSLVLGAVTLLIFFFRRRFAKRFDNYDREKQTKE